MNCELFDEVLFWWRPTSRSQWRGPMLATVSKINADGTVNVFPSPDPEEDTPYTTRCVGVPVIDEQADEGLAFAIRRTQ